MILIVSGDDRFRRKRTIKTVTDAQRRSGLRVFHTTPEGLEAHTDTGLFEEKKVVVVAGGETTDPGKIPSDLYVLFELDGDLPEKTPLGVWAKANPAFHRSFKKPSTWDAPKDAAEFLQEEAQNVWTKKLSPVLAAAIVARSGTDLGVLSFELAKVCILADGHEISAENIRDAIAPLGDADLAPLSEAIGEKSPVKVARVLTRIEAMQGRGVTIRVTRFLVGQIGKWYALACALESMPVKDAAATLRLNPWYAENKLAPAARKLGPQTSARLLSALAKGERAVFDGHLNPWGVLTSNLLMALT
jgi:DNA polymerase III delta subunit